jgi:hypothetical protein
VNEDEQVFQAAPAHVHEPASVVESTERALSEVEQGSAQGLLDNRNVRLGSSAHHKLEDTYHNIKKR